MSDNLQRHQGCSLLCTGMKNAFSEAQYVTLSLFSEKPPSIFALCRSLSLSPARSLLFFSECRVSISLENRNKSEPGSRGIVGVVAAATCRCHINTHRYERKDASVCESLNEAFGCPPTCHIRIRIHVHGCLSLPASDSN